MQTIKDVKALRRRHRKSQTEFWATIGITQSGGSRYENGRRIPRSIQTLLALAYGPESLSERVLRKLRQS